MCFGGGSSAKAPLATPDVTPENAYQRVTTSSIPSTDAPQGTTGGTGSTIATTSPFQKQSGTGLTGM